MPAAKSRPPGANESTIKTRDYWMAEVAAQMGQWFNDLDFPLPPIQILSGFPSAGRRGRNIAESWTHDDGDSYVIFVRPDSTDPIEVAAAIAHQLCQIASGRKDQHGHLFRHLAISIGLRGRKAESRPGAVFTQLMQPIIERVGEWSTPELDAAHSQQIAKQKARLIKVTCKECGYIARVSRKWLDSAGPPLCPQHGRMTSVA